MAESKSDPGMSEASSPNSFKIFPFKTAVELAKSSAFPIDPFTERAAVSRSCAPDRAKFLLVSKMKIGMKKSFLRQYGFQRGCGKIRLEPKNPTRRRILKMKQLILRV